MGCQLEHVLSAEVLHACTGMKPSGANSLWRSDAQSLHESASMTEKPGAQPARFCGGGEIGDANRTSQLTNHEEREGCGLTLLKVLAHRYPSQMLLLQA